MTYSQNIRIDTPGEYRITAEIGISPADQPAENLQPVARIAGPLTATVGDTVTLDGTASRDQDGSLTDWIWTINGGPLGRGSTLAIPATSPGTHTIGLTVVDDRGATASAETTLVIAAAPEPEEPPTDPEIPAEPRPDAREFYLNANAGPLARIADLELRPGDTVYVDGTFRPTGGANDRMLKLVGVRGTIDRPITISGMSNVLGGTVISGKRESGDNTATPVELRDCEYVHVRDLDFEDTGAAALDAAGESVGLWFRDVRVQRASQTGRNTVPGIRIIGPSRDCTIERCRVAFSRRGIEFRESPTQTRETACTPPGHKPENAMPESQWAIWPGWVDIGALNGRIIDCLTHDNGTADLPENSDGQGARYATNVEIRGGISFRNMDDGFDLVGCARASVSKCIALLNNHTHVQGGDGNGFKLGVRGGLGHVIQDCIALWNHRCGLDMADGEWSTAKRLTLLHNGRGHKDGFGYWIEAFRAAQFAAYLQKCLIAYNAIGSPSEGRCDIGYQRGKTIVNPAQYCVTSGPQTSQWAFPMYTNCRFGVADLGLSGIGEEFDPSVLNLDYGWDLPTEDVLMSIRSGVAGLLMPKDGSVVREVGCGASLEWAMPF